MKMKNDDGSMGILFFLLVSVGVISFVIMVSGTIMEKTNAVHNNISASGSVVLSQERQDAMSSLQDMLGAMAPVGFVLSIVCAVIASKEAHDRGV